jgi:hypothetical protein
MLFEKELVKPEVLIEQHKKDAAASKLQKWFRRLKI